MDNWDKIYKNRLAWAYEARQKFIGSLSGKLKLSFNEQNRKGIVVAVYGNSQVGKTSLILKLIGIKDALYDEIYDVLRCDIPKGKSVTATSMIYKKSEDKNFYIRLCGQNQEPIDKSKLKSRLKELRKSVEENRFETGTANHEGNIQISIPPKYFKETEYDLVIIDLPGISSSNIKEHKHVESVITDIIPIASLVLFVCEKITHFDPDQIQLPEMKKWYREPDRFRLILTRAVSANSVKGLFQNNKQVTLNNYLNYYRSEFERTFKDQKGLFDERRIRIYPLEYGESYSQLKLDEHDIYKKSKMLIDELLEKLYKDIKDNTTEHKLLLRMANYWSIIEKDLADQIASIDNNILKIEEEKRKILEEQTRLEKYIEHKEGDLGNKNSEIKKYNSLLQSYTSGDEKIKTQPEAVKDNETNRKYFRNAIAKFCALLLSNINELCTELKHDYDIDLSAEVKSRNIERILDGNFSDFKVRLDHYEKDKYYPWWTNNFNKDRAYLKQCCENSVSEVNKFLSEIINNKIRSHIDALRTTFKLLESEKGDAVKKSEGKKETIRVNNRRILDLKKEKDEVQAAGKDAKEKCANFFRCLEDEFNNQFSNVMENINRTSGVNQLFAILDGYLIASEMEKLEKEHQLFKDS